MQSERRDRLVLGLRANRAGDQQPEECAGGEAAQVARIVDHP
jgi:hypothetical protein